MFLSHPNMVHLNDSLLCLLTHMQGGTGNRGTNAFLFDQL